MPGYVWEKNLELTQPLLDDAMDGAPECVVRHPDDDEDGLGLAKTEYYQWDPLRWALSQLLAIFTLGISLLVFRWCPVWALTCTHRRSTPARATCVLAEGTDGISIVVPILPVLEVDAPEGDAPAPGELPSAPPVPAMTAAFSPYEKRGANRVEIPRRFEFRHMLYFETRHGSFAAVTFKDNISFASLVQMSASGLSEDEVQRRRGFFGDNLAKVPVKSHLQLLLDEILHPFYIFQVWSVIVWYLEPYILYATTIAVISVFSALVSLLSTRANLLKIRDMAQFSCPVRVVRRRAGERAQGRETVDSSQLVPGDVIEVDDGMVMPCDAVITSGSVVVNESMLTGESLPVLKTAVPVHSSDDNDLFDSDRDKRFILFCGTKAMEARPVGRLEKVHAIVLRTGFTTAKGRLVRSILFPKPTTFKFNDDSFKFIAVMATMAVCGFISSIQSFIEYKVELRDIILNACDIVTIAVPPALPAAMTIGIEFAIERLKKANIFCISPWRVNLAGRLDAICFDKTGTLTEDGVDVLGAAAVGTAALPTAPATPGTPRSPALRAMAAASLHTPGSPRRASVVPGGPALGPVSPVQNAPDLLLQCLACCHSLTIIDGKLIGDPLDLKMFDATGWTLCEPPLEDRHDSVVPPLLMPPQFRMPSRSFAGEDAAALVPMTSFDHQMGLEGLNDPALRESPSRGGVAIVRRFEFSSNHQRMSVVGRTDVERGSHIFLKGAPEVVASLCDPATIPADFLLEVQRLTRQGFRTLACAHKYDPAMSWHQAQKVTRDAAEKDMTLLGVLVLENRLKPQSAGVLAALQKAQVEVNMVTGDHVLTGVTVSRNCGLIHPTRPVYLCELAPPEHPPAKVVEHDTRHGNGSHSHAIPDHMSEIGEDRAMEALALETDTPTSASFRENRGMPRSRANSDMDLPEMLAAIGENRAEGLETLGGGEDSMAESFNPSSSLLWESHHPDFLSEHSRDLSALALESDSHQSHQDKCTASEVSASEVGGRVESVSGFGCGGSKFSKSCADEVRVVFCNIDETPEGMPPISLNEMINICENALLSNAIASSAKAMEPEGVTREEGDEQHVPLLSPMDRSNANHASPPGPAGGGGNGGAGASWGMVQSLEEWAGVGNNNGAEIAITGTVWAALHKKHKEEHVRREESDKTVAAGGGRATHPPTVLERLLPHTRVYARMSPEQKQQLVELLAEARGKVVGMCGDGANDCGALKAAAVGLSLSDAEASIAAPFTSSTQNITPLLQLMREGRAALATSVACFKYMALYSAIQFITILRLYHINANMSDFQYLWIDLFMIFPLAVYMGRTGPYETLSVERPNGRLISFPVLSSVLGQVIIAVAFQGLCAMWTLHIDNFKCNAACPLVGGVCDPSGVMEHCCFAMPLGCPTRPIVPDTDDNVVSVEATSAFLFSQFQYLGVVIAFNTSKPFRRSMTSNYLFFGTLVTLIIASTLFLLAPHSWIKVLDFWMDNLELEPFPNKGFKWRLFALALVNFVVCYSYEVVVERADRRRSLAQKLQRGKALRVAVRDVSALLLALLAFSLAPFFLVLLPAL